jgi:hypothetical protein
VFLIFRLPATILAIRAWQGLGAVSLRTALIHGDSVEQVCFLGRRYLTLLHLVLNQGQGLALEIGFSDGVLRNEPRCQGTVSTYQVAVGPAMFGNDFPEPVSTLARCSRFYDAGRQEAMNFAMSCLAF